MVLRRVWLSLSNPSGYAAERREADEEAESGIGEGPAFRSTELDVPDYMSHCLGTHNIACPQLQTKAR